MSHSLHRLDLVAACIATTLLALAGGEAQAASACKLTQLAELPVTMVGSRPTVPVKINGHEAPFFIDSGASFGTIAAPWAKRLDVHPTVAPGYTLRGVGGTQDLLYAKIDQFDLANLPLRHIDFFVAEGGLEPSIAGVVGENLLGAFDTEYDFANGVMRLIRPKGCGGGDVLSYWTDRPTVLQALPG